MKNVIVAFCCGVVLCACQTKPDGYTVKGHVAGSQDGMKVILMDESVFPSVAVDSTVIQNEQFQLKGKLEFPAMHRLIIDKTGKGDESDMLVSRFYLENSEIALAGHIDSLPTYYWSADKHRKPARVTGSATQDLYQQYEEQTEDLARKAARINDEYIKVYHLPALEGTYNTEQGIVLAKQLAEVDREREVARWNFIEQHPESVVGYDLAGHFLEGMYVNLTVPQIDQLTEIIAKGWAAYPERVAAFKEKAENAKRMAIGAKYQDIELTNPEGKIVKLSEYVPEGKYVMLEFWASWCGPCRGEIPHLRHVYQNYKDKGFEIISISIDQNDADWKKAMKEEQMVWKQLCDPNGFEGPVVKAYHVMGVPTCIILDKEGRIFKTDMRGAALDAVLEELY